MIKKIRQRIQLYCKLQFIRYLHLNYFCKNVVRTDNSRILPYKHAVLDLEPGSRIWLGGGDLEIGCDRLRGSKAETLVRLRRGAVWSSEGGCRISYGVTLEVLQEGLLDTQFFTANTGSVIITAKKLQIGRDVMIGRNVIVYDSDHHAIRNPYGEITNPDAPIKIGDQVWLATNATVKKGTAIGSNSLIGANTVAHGNIPANTIYQTVHTEKTRTGYGSWHREHPVI